jgi:hypothetical protein
MLTLAVVTGCSGLYLGLRAYKNFVSMTRGETLPGGTIKNSIVAGGCGFLIFFTIIMAMGILDETYVWTIGKFYGAIIFSLIPGVIISIGSFIQSLMITGYKDILQDYLRQKNKHK